MGISSYVDWPPEDPLEEELIELEFELKHCIEDIKTSIGCRREFLKHYKYDEPSDMFIDDIRSNLKLKRQQRSQIPQGLLIA